MKVREKRDEVFLKSLGGRISTIRKEKGISQVELSFRCDIEKTNMNRIEAGNTNPSILMLKKISEALEISLAELFEI